MTNRTEILRLPAGETQFEYQKAEAARAERAAQKTLVRHMQCLVPQTFTLREFGWEWTDGGVAFDLALGMLREARETGATVVRNGLSVSPSGVTVEAN